MKVHEHPQNYSWIFMICLKRSYYRPWSEGDNERSLMLHFNLKVVHGNHGFPSIAINDNEWFIGYQCMLTINVVPFGSLLPTQCKRIAEWWSPVILHKGIRYYYSQMHNLHLITHSAMCICVKNMVISYQNIKDTRGEIKWTGGCGCNSYSLWNLIRLQW